MMFLKMTCQIFNLMTVQVIQLTTLLTFHMIAAGVMTLALSIDIFEAGRTGFIQNILIYTAFFHKSLKLPVNGGCSDISAFFPEMGTYVLHRKMLFGNGF